MKRHEAIFFDVGYTLLDPVPSEYTLCYLVCREHGFSGTEQDMIKILDAVWRDWVKIEILDNPASNVTSDEEDLEWWRRLYFDLFEQIGLTNKEKAFQSIYRLFYESNSWRPYSDVLEVLEDIKASGYILGVISNWNSHLPRICKEIGIDKYFDFILASAIAGFKKPDARIFEKALSLAGVEPRKAIHVGDSYIIDFMGAKKAGIDAILLDRENRYAQTNYQTINHLKEIYSFLK